MLITWGRIHQPVVGGAVAPGGPYDPDQIAGHYWRLHTQPQPAWEHEVLVEAGRK